MAQSLPVQREFAKPAGVQKCPSTGPKIRKILPFELFLRELWPEERNKAKSYMRLTGATASTAKHRLKGRRKPSYEEIVEILRSEAGYEFLKFALGNVRPEWFTAFERAKNIGEMRRQQQVLSRRLAQVEMGI